MFSFTKNIVEVENGGIKLKPSVKILYKFSVGIFVKSK